MNRRMFVGLMAGAAVCSPSKFSTETRAESKPPDTKRMLEVTRVPGVAVAGMKDEGPYQLLAGVARAGGPAVTLQTRFPAASLSKPVFAWAVQTLMKQGKIDLNRPLQDYIDLGLEGTARKITALHVLTHSTGLPNWRFQPDLPLASAFEPGTTWQYSGEGFVLLQRVVEKITGRPIAEYMRTTVLEPLGMSQSTYAWSPEIQGLAALGHDRHGALLEKSPGAQAPGSNNKRNPEPAIAGDSGKFSRLSPAAAGSGPLFIGTSTWGLRPRLYAYACYRRLRNIVRFDFLCKAARSNSLWCSKGLADFRLEIDMRGKDIPQLDLAADRLHWTAYLSVIGILITLLWFSYFTTSKRARSVFQ